MSTDVLMEYCVDRVSIKGRSRVSIKGIDRRSTADALSTHDPGKLRKSQVRKPLGQTAVMHADYVHIFHSMQCIPCLFLSNASCDQMLTRMHLEYNFVIRVGAVQDVLSKLE